MAFSGAELMRKHVLSLADGTLKLSQSRGAEVDVLWCARLDSPLPQISVRSLTMDEFSFEIETDATEGERIAALRHVGILLDITNAERCEVLAGATHEEGIREAARHVGLTVVRRGDARYVERPSAEPFVRDLVSVLVAGYNARFLTLALESVEKQTWPHIEIVVRDDCPSDAVRIAVDAFASRSTKYPVRYEKNAERLGVRKNYESCFRLARGEFCKFLNDDDLLDATCIERMATALKRSPSAHLATSHRRRIDERGFPLSDQPATTPICRDDLHIDGISLVNALLLLGLNFIGEPTTTLFRTCTARIDDEALIGFLGREGRGLADLTLWCKLALRGDCVFLAERLSSFRIHSEQQTLATDVASKALVAIPELRDRWLTTGLHEHVPPNLLRVLQTSERMTSIATRDDWYLHVLQLFTPPGAVPEQQLVDWRAKRHLFFMQSLNEKSDR